MYLWYFSNLDDLLIPIWEGHMAYRTMNTRSQTKYIAHIFEICEVSFIWFNFTLYWNKISKNHIKLLVSKAIKILSMECLNQLWTSYQHTVVPSHFTSILAICCHHFRTDQLTSGNDSSEHTMQRLSNLWLQESKTTCNTRITRSQAK